MVDRNFRTNPITLDEQMLCYWHAVTDDTIGGYAISNVDEPVSQLNPYEGNFEFANFMTKEVAQHIAEIHNAWYQDFIWKTDYQQNYVVSLYNDSIRRVIDSCDLSPEDQDYGQYVDQMAQTYEDLPEAMKSVKL